MSPFAALRRGLGAGTEGVGTAHRRRPSWTARVALVLLVVVGLVLGNVARASALTVTPRPANLASSGSFLDVQANTQTSALALDPAGGEHVVFDRYTSAAYAYCAPGANCAIPAQWGQVALVPSVLRIKAPSQIQLTPDGKPRVLFTVETASNTTSFRYATCDSGCTQISNWTVISLGSAFTYDAIFDQNGAQAHFFALDPQGRPRFVYSHQNDGGVGRLYYASCDSGCATSVSNWAQTTVSRGTGANEPLSNHYTSLSLDFTAAGQPRVAGFSNELFMAGAEDTALAYLQCDSSCTAPEPSDPMDSPWSVTALEPMDNHFVMLRLDNAGAPHLALDDGRLRYLWCTGTCATTASWSGVVLEMAGAFAYDGADPDLVFDAQNRPRLAFKASSNVGSGLGYAWCDASCDTISAPWQARLIDDASAFSTLATEGSCAGQIPAVWIVGFRSSLALDGAGNPHVSYTGDHVRRDCAGNQVTNHTVVRAIRFRSKPAVADFDGNGTSDKAVFRPSTGQWFVLGGSPAVTVYGASGDIPVPLPYAVRQVFFP